MLPTIRKGETVSLPLLEAEPTLADLNYRMAYEDTSTAVNGSPMDLGLEAGRRCGNCARYSDGRCVYARGRPPVDRSGICDAWLGSTRHPMMGYRRDGAGPKYYDQQSMPDYGEIYGVDALEDAAEQARSDAELRRRAAAARMVHRYGFHGEAPGPVRVQDVEAQANQVEPHRPGLRAKATEPRLVLRTGPMSKGGPYIGPRGGKWADAAHTIPWKEGGDRGAGQSEEPKRSYMSETFYHSSRKPLNELRQGKFSVTDDREASEEYLNEEEGHVYEVKVPDDLKLADDDEVKEIARELDPDTPYQRAYEHVDEEPEVMRELQRRGFDGIHIDDETPDNQREHKTITVFDPVKSGLVFREVTGKSGAMSLQSSINELESLLKAGPRGGKYYRRVPTGNPKRPWRYYYSKEQYDRAHGDGAHVNGDEAKQARASKEDKKRGLQILRNANPGDRLKVNGKEMTFVSSYEIGDALHSGFVEKKPQEGKPFSWTDVYKHGDRKTTVSVNKHTGDAGRITVTENFRDVSSEQVDGASIISKQDETKKGFGPNWDARCLIHGRDLHKASFHEPYATCSCPK